MYARGFKFYRTAILYNNNIIRAVGTKKPIPEIKNKIFYTSTDGKVIAPYTTTGFGANIVSNTYVGGQGVIEFDDDITALPTRAFYAKTKLRSIEIPSSVQSIGTYAFQSCQELTSFEIPYGVPTISDSTFVSCIKLSSITIPDSVQSIGTYAFQNCYDLREITIPDSVVSIGDMAFYNSVLTELNIGSGLTSIGSSTFGLCPLDSITISPNNPKYDSRDNCNAINITSSNTLILGCNNTVIPNTIETISGSAFTHCNTLTKLVIPDSVITIKNYAIQNCYDLSEISFGSGLTSISGESIRNCNNLTTM